MKAKKLLSSVVAAALAISTWGGGLLTTANAATNNIYSRALVADETSGTAAWSATDVSATEWVTTGTSVSTSDTDKGLYLKSNNSAYSAVKGIKPTNNSIITLEAVWNSGTANGRSGNYTYLQLGNSISFAAKTQDQTGLFVVGNTPTTMTGFCKDKSNRTYDDWKIKLVVDTAQNKITTVSVISSLASEVSYTAENIDLPVGATYDSISMGFYKAGRTGDNDCSLKSISLTEVTQDIQTANYSIKYVCGENVVKTVSGSGVVGGVPIIDIDMFDVEKQRYICDSNDLEGKTIAADGSTVVTVQCHAAANYEMSVVASTDANKVFASATVVEGDNFAYAYPKYITDENNKVLATCDNTTYSVTVTPTKSETITIPYTAYVGTAYFMEGEKAVSGTNLNDNRLSGGTSVNHMTSDKTILTVAEEGVYRVTTRGLTSGINKDSAMYVYKNNSSDEANLIDYLDLNKASVNYILTQFVDGVELAAGDVIVAKGAESNSALDYILIEKVPSITTMAAQEATIADGTTATAADGNGTLDISGKTAYTIWYKLNNITETQPLLTLKNGETTIDEPVTITQAEVGTDGYYCVQILSDGLASGDYTATLAAEGVTADVTFTIPAAV